MNDASPLIETGPAPDDPRRVRRLEDIPLVTGAGRFVGDMNFSKQLHLRVVRSSVPHGRLIALDATEALKMPGVVAIWNGANVANIPLIDFRADKPLGNLGPYRQPILAQEFVRYVGEPVAAVFAEDPYLAEDAAEAVVADIELMRPIVSASDEPSEFAPGLSSEAIALHQQFGDIEAAFGNADKIVEIDVSIGRHAGIPMETRGAIGVYTPEKDLLELYGAAKIPHRNRETLCRMLGRDPATVHLHEGHVGGGFGIRGELYPEDFLVLLGAMRLGRPIKWIEDRHEHLMAANQGREQRHLARMALKSDGTILGIEDEFFHNQGAYLRTHGVSVPTVTLNTLPGPYKLPAYRAIGHVRMTNKTPAATYRSPGRFESAFVRARLVDAAAAALGIGVLDIHRRNFITVDEMPYRVPFDEHGGDTGVEIDSGNYELLLDKALAAFRWEETRRGIERRRAAGELVGLGLSFMVDSTGRGPCDNAKISVDRSGDVSVVTGGASVGQGFETAMAQICARALGVDYRRVRVVHGQTDLIDFGIGAHAARATGMTGGAVHETALLVRRKALVFAAQRLQTPSEELDIVCGIVRRSDGATGPSLLLGEIAREMALVDPDGLFVHGWYHADHSVYPYGVHIAMVRVDEGTGAVAVERLMIAYDVGYAINPTMVEGQLIGGAAQGIGGSLLEEFVYNESGAPLSVTFADYLMPTALDVPKIEVLVTEDAPSPRHPLGLKGAGEGGITGVGGAIAGAIDDALGMPGAVTQIPMTPQRVKALLRRISRP